MKNITFYEQINLFLKNKGQRNSQPMYAYTCMRTQVWCMRTQARTCVCNYGSRELWKTSFLH